MAKTDAGGVAPYQGYEYQIEVTVWLGLVLMLQRGWCDAVSVEPACLEDVAADLDVLADEAVAELGLSGPDKFELRVQVKRRQPGHWDRTAFGDLLGGRDRPSGSRGPARRQPPLADLNQDSALRYLLVTDAQCEAGLHEFRVSTIGEMSAAKSLPGRVPKGVDEAGIAPRVGILPQQTEGWVRSESLRLLGETGFVPSGRRSDCLAALTTRVRNALLARADKSWTQAELVDTLRRFDGSPLEDRDLQLFVAPSNFDDLERQLRINSKLVLSGPPGTGKTLAAQKLLHPYRVDADPFRVITAPTPHEVWSLLATAERVIVYLPDPLGQGGLSPDWRPWAAELPKLLGRAGPDKRLLVTSPLGVLDQALGRDRTRALGDAEFGLAPEHYDQPRRIEILRRTTERYFPSLLDSVVKKSVALTERLTVPLSIYFFVQGLSRLVEKRVSLEELIAGSQMEAIGKRLASEIQALDIVEGAVVVWAYITSGLGLSSEEMKLARQALKEGGVAHPADLEKVVRGLRGAGWINLTARQEAHPSVTAGLGTLLDEEPAAAEDTLVPLLLGLGRTGRADVAFELLKRAINRRYECPAELLGPIHSHLLGRAFAEEDYRFRWSLSDLADWGIKDRLETLFVQAMLTFSPRTIGRVSVGYQAWAAPNWEDGLRELVAGSGEARELAKRFILFVLTDDYMHTYPSTELLSFFARLGWDYSELFAEAFCRVVERGESGDEKLLAAGALCGPNPPIERLLNHTLDAQGNLDRRADEFHNHREQAGDALSDEYLEHMYETFGGEASIIQSGLEGIIDAQRGRDGYEWLTRHPRIDDLLRPWASSLERLGKRADLSELNGLMAAWKLPDRKPLWRAVAASRVVDLAPVLVGELVACRESQVGDCLDSVQHVLSADAFRAWAADGWPALTDERRATIRGALEQRSREEE